MTGPAVGEDFASATMMRIIAAGLERQCIPAPLRAPAGARVPRSGKRELLDAVMSAHGPAAILAISDAARHMPPEPVAQAMLCAQDAADLLGRWHRLERFSHARHRVESERLSGNRFRLRHRARDDGPPPSPAESLLVLAVLATLAEMIGSGPVNLATEAGEVWRASGAWREPSVASRIGSVILLVSPIPAPADPASERPGNDLVDMLRRRLAADPLRRWTVADLAAETATSSRTLQRRLAEKSVSFSRLVAEARLQVAASCLCDASGPDLAEIGFLAGYSDQAHFARSFSRAVGTTPRAYRADFQA